MNLLLKEMHSQKPGMFIQEPEEMFLLTIPVWRLKLLMDLPGVHSARFAGENKDSSANIEKVLEMLGDNKNRKARFRTVIALILKR